MSTQMAGGWSPFNELKAEDKEVFAKGIEGLSASNIPLWLWLLKS